MATPKEETTEARTLITKKNKLTAGAEDKKGSVSKRLKRIINKPNLEKIAEQAAQKEAAQAAKEAKKSKATKKGLAEVAKQENHTVAKSTQNDKEIARLEEAQKQQAQQEAEQLREIWGNRYTNANIFAVGNWDNKISDNFALRAACADNTIPPEEQEKNHQKLTKQQDDMAYLKTSKIQDNPNWQLKPEDVVQTSSGADSSYAAFAYNYSKQTLFINDKNLEQQKDNPSKLLSEAAKGNPVALNCAIYHEFNHKKNWENDGLGLLSYTPVNAVKGTILTEKLSLSTEYLYMAKEYNERKLKGDTTIKYNDGTEKPLDSLLEIHPGLKETIEKYGSDINNPEVKREIVKTAMNCWEQDRKNDYQDQITNEARWGNTYFSQSTFSEQTELLKNEEQTYQTVAEKCLKDVNIGGQQLDLSDCKDLIDTYTSENAKQMIAEHNKKNTDNTEAVYVPTYQEYQEINQYLESIGKTTDAEKMDHIAKTVRQGTHSLEPYDKKLEEIMLSHNQKITSGALEIEKTDDKVIGKLFDEKYDLTEYAAPKKTETKAPTQQMPMNTLAAIKLER